MKQRVLIIEDDITFGLMLEKWFGRNGYDAFLCSKIAVAKQEIEKKEYDLVLSDLRLPDGDGIMLLQWIKGRKIETPFIIMTSYAEVQSAVSAIKLGAEDYLEKPIVSEVFKEKVEAALMKTKINKTNNHKILFKENDRKASGMIIGRSPLACQVYDHILKVAPTKMSVLILGESGTGKEYAAKTIHDHSSCSDKSFIAVDCGSLSKELAPSELFGHLKGSFTSAVENKIGVFEQANGGTVFLDEVGNLSYEVQVQLLRALQEHKIRRVGSNEDTSINVRFIAATNEDLERAIAEGRFREDLYHRLNEFSIFLPPLRDREGDIKIFAEEFLSQANKELDKKVIGFSPETMKLLEKHSWSGNLRELRNVVRRAVLFATEETISPKDLPVLIDTRKEDLRKEDLSLRPRNEKEQIEAALRRARGNKTLAAQILKIDRKTLYNKIHLYKIEL